MGFEQWWAGYRENIDPAWEGGAKLIAKFAWDAAVAAERERCAKIIESFNAKDDDGNPLRPGLAEWVGDDGAGMWCPVPEAVAAYIREGKP